MRTSQLGRLVSLTALVAEQTRRPDSWRRWWATTIVEATADELRTLLRFDPRLTNDASTRFRQIARDKVNDGAGLEAPDERGSMSPRTAATINRDLNQAAMAGGGWDRTKGLGRLLLIPSPQQPAAARSPHSWQPSMTIIYQQQNRVKYVAAQRFTCSQQSTAINDRKLLEREEYQFKTRPV